MYDLEGCIPCRCIWCRPDGVQRKFNLLIPKKRIYGVILICFIPNLSHKFFINTPINCVPWSLSNVIGTPFLEKISNSASAHSPAVACLRGIASGYLVARQMYVRRYLNPFHLGKGPTISIATFSKGVLWGQYRIKEYQVFPNTFCLLNCVPLYACRLCII